MERISKKTTDRAAPEDKLHQSSATNYAITRINYGLTYLRVIVYWGAVTIHGRVIIITLASSNLLFFLGSWDAELSSWALRGFITKHTCIRAQSVPLVILSTKPHNILPKTLFLLRTIFYFKFTKDYF